MEPDLRPNRFCNTNWKSGSARMTKCSGLQDTEHCQDEDDENYDLYDGGDDDDNDDEDEDNDGAQVPYFLE